MKSLMQPAAIFLLLFTLDGFTAQLDLETRYNAIQKASAESAGGQAVLRHAYEAVDGGSYKHVGLEDLWAFALKEGRILFDSPGLWRATGPEETGDMLNQTTIGPWQITIANARKYGKRYAIQTEWSDIQVTRFLEVNSELQAQLAADLIEEAYKFHGKRSPYAIQSYFWLEAFVRKEIGQGPWYASVLARKNENRRNTGFYAKQLVLGSKYNPEGLLYWLYISGDDRAVSEVLETWNKTGFAIRPEDLAYCSCPDDFRQYLLKRLALSGYGD